MFLCFEMVLAQDVVNIIQSNEIDNADEIILQALSKKHGNTKAVLLIEIDGKINEQTFIILSRPCRCDPDYPDRYNFYTRNQKIVLEITDPSAKLIVNNFSHEIDDELAMKISMMERQFAAIKTSSEN
jgi:hypothetical protein